MGDVQAAEIAPKRMTAADAAYHGGSAVAAHAAGSGTNGPARVPTQDSRIHRFISQIVPLRISANEIHSR